MLTTPGGCDVYEWLEEKIRKCEPIPHAICHDGCIYLAKPISPELSEGSLIEDIGFRFDAERNVWCRCKTCLGVSYVDCCEELDCKKCNGLFARWCEDCEAGRGQIAIDKAEKKFKDRALSR